MTPQEAKKELEEEFEIFKSGIDSTDWENPNEELKKIIEANTMAIKALKQQPCEDSISRQVVKEMLTETWTKYMPMELDINLSFVLDKISALPSVTPSYNSVKTELEQTRWIPVSERLPEDDGYYLTTTMYGEVYCDYWTEINFDRQETVVAWMPLPQPYKAENEDEE